MECPAPQHPDPAAGQPPAKRWADAGSWQPPPDGFFATLQIFGSPEQVQRAVEQIAQTIDVVLNMDAATVLPADAWDQLPPRLLTAVQREIVREDLRHTKRSEMARSLCVSPNTITAYRTQIRKKFSALPPEQRPLWALVWLRRFPGRGAPRRRGPGRKRR
ncbi:MAG TPA: hypothetical protein VFS21_17050 [Roseiflexaceae bacterium]|nr:hypothetical protein [Roseiflexaceae bacterium]